MTSPPRPALTAVLLTSSEAAASRILHGTPVESRPHHKGAVALLAPGELVVYSFRARKTRTFVFRTLAAPEDIATRVPGVTPAVRLLLHTHSLGRLRRLEELLRYLERIGCAPSALSDRFYSRLHAILSGRLPPGKVLRSLLVDEHHLAARA